MSGKGWNLTLFFLLFELSRATCSRAADKNSLFNFNSFFCSNLYSVREFKFHFNFHLNCKRKQVSKARVQWEVWNQREHWKWDSHSGWQKFHANKFQFNCQCDVERLFYDDGRREKRQFEHFITAQKTKMRWYHFIPSNWLVVRSIVWAFKVELISSQFKLIFKRKIE